MRERMNRDSAQLKCEGINDCGIVEHVFDHVKEIKRATPGILGGDGIYQEIYRCTSCEYKRVWGVHSRNYKLVNGNFVEVSP